ncbi:MAG: LpqB family beta-propeller domain-containing protein [Kineosporiaceae bacterium]
MLARILDGGAYHASDPGDIEVVTFHLTVADGQWRISDPVDGVMISQSDFSATFGDLPLYFPENTGRWLVPDVRWFPLTSSLTVVVDALLDGPSGWLQGAVTSGAPSGTALTANGVRSSAGSVMIDLTRGALAAGPAQRQVLFAQLKATLNEAARLLGIATGDLTVTVEQARYEIPQTTAAMPRPADELGLDARPVVLDTQNRLARLDGLRSAPVPGLAALPADATRPAVNADGTAFAALVAGGSSLLTLSAQQAPRQTLLPGSLTAPSIDLYGWVWTSPTQSAGTVFAVRGTQTVAVPGKWLAGYQVRSVRISREGTRALVVAGRSGRSYAFVTAVVRDEAGRPTGFTDPPLRLVSDLVGARDGAWLDARRIAVLGTRPAAPEQRVWLVQIGGEVSAGVAAPEALTITLGSSQYELWVQTAEGAAYLAGSDFPRLPGVRWPAVPG